MFTPPYLIKYLCAHSADQKACKSLALSSYESTKGIPPLGFNRKVKAPFTNNLAIFRDKYIYAAICPHHIELNAAGVLLSTTVGNSSPLRITIKSGHPEKKNS